MVMVSDESTSQSLSSSGWLSDSGRLAGWGRGSAAQHTAAQHTAAQPRQHSHGSSHSQRQAQWAGTAALGKIALRRQVRWLL
jgi:hypothetical protein